MATPYVLEIVRSGIDMAQAVVVLMTPDDEVRLMDQFSDEHDEPDSSGQARPNVVLELGMAIALYPERTILVRMGHLRSISDLGGLYQIRLDDSAAKRQYLHDRLQDCGCEVNLQGRWREAGDFTAALNTVGNLPIAQTRRPADEKSSTGLTVPQDLVEFEVPADAPDIDKPGFLDILAEGEGAFERVVAVLEEATVIMNEASTLAVNSTAEIKRVDSEHGGMRARLAVVARHAQKLGPLADRYDALSETYLAEWRNIQSATEYLVQQIETNEEARTSAIQTGFPDSLKSFAASVVESAGHSTALATTLDESGAAAKILRQVTSKMAAAARRWSEPVSIATDWRSRLEAIGL